ncbi:MAG: hypothetical protein EOQ56_27975 [Mesorhizobium sp.]|nr:MAG: hypothetical protein EOQ56_27975 [Mesorhizobium sp.]
MLNVNPRKAAADAKKARKMLANVGLGLVTTDFEPTNSPGKSFNRAKKRRAALRAKGFNR